MQLFLFLFLLISSIAFSNGGQIINPHLDRLLQGSFNYGSGPSYTSFAKKSHASYGSGVESKYSTAGSGLNHGSNVMRGSNAKYGSGKVEYGSNAKYGSNVMRGSYKQCSRTSHDYVFSGTVSSSKTKHYSYAIKVSGAHKGSGSYIGSGPHKGSSSKKGSNVPYNIFSPTMQPTEALPPIYEPPPPTYYPTLSTNIPKIPLSFEKPTNEGIEVPLIPLSFQIEQGANGWAQYPDSPPLDSLPLEKAFAQVASKTAGVSANSIANMNVKKTTQRKLSETTKITVTYDIITTPASNGEKTQAETYYKIANKLALSVKNNNFSADLHRLGVTFNVSSIAFSNYAVFYPTLTPTSSVNVLSSSFTTSDTQNMTMEAVCIGLGIILILGLFGIFGVVYLKKKDAQKIKKEVSLTETPVHLERVSNPMTDVIPDPLRRITITHTPTPTLSE
jgi:hypothetical protein